ncbi:MULTISPECIES: small protein YadW [Citrobacter]
MGSEFAQLPMSFGAKI